MEVLGGKYFFQLYIEVRLTAEMFSLHNEKFTSVPFISLHFTNFHLFMQIL